MNSRDGSVDQKQDWCEVLDIEAPCLEAVKDHREANTYALLIVALLERGAALSLAEVAERFEAAGIDLRGRALRSLQRCRPGRPPVYREGDLYMLDPHDDELDLWVFRLGLRPPKTPQMRVMRPEPPALPGVDIPLSATELDEAWRDASLHGALRLKWGFLDERIPAPWVHRDEPTLYHLEKTALETGAALEVVVGNAPGWSEPWARARRVHVERDRSGWRTWLVDEGGRVIDYAEVQRARLVPSG